MKTVAGDVIVLDESSALMAAACLFHGFSDPSRLAIVRHLAAGEHRVVDLTEHLGLAQSTVSKHLACLKDCGLVTSRPQGRASMWSLNHTDTVMQLLSAAHAALRHRELWTLWLEHGHALDLPDAREPDPRDLRGSLGDEHVERLLALDAQRAPVTR